MKYNMDAYETHKETLENLLNDYDEWAEFVTSSVKYDFTRFGLYYTGKSSANDIVMTLRGSKLTVAETISRLHRLFDELSALEKEFTDEVNNAE